MKPRRLLLSLAALALVVAAAHAVPPAGPPVPTTRPVIVDPALQERQDAARLGLDAEVRVAREPLGEARGRLESRSGMRFSVDWKSLDAAGIGRETPAAVDWRDGEKVAAALGRTLAAAGEGKAPLGYTVDGTGGIVIASERELFRRHLVTRWYDLRDLLPKGPREFTFSKGPTVPPRPFKVADGPPHLPLHLWDSLESVGRAVDPAWKVGSGWDLGVAAQERGPEGIVRFTATRLHHLRFSELLAQFRAVDQDRRQPPGVPSAGAEHRPAPRNLRDGWTMEAVQRHLDHRITQLRFEALGLSDVVEGLSDVTGFPVECNWTALAAAGVGKETPLSLQRGVTPFREALDLVLKAAQSHTKHRLHHWIDTDRWTIVITTFDDYVAADSVTRTYDVGVALSLAPVRKDGDVVDALSALIVKSVAPGTWEGTNTKPGVVRRGPDSELIVTHLRAHHAEVEALIGRVIKEGFPR